MDPLVVAARTLVATYLRRSQANGKPGTAILGSPPDKLQHKGRLFDVAVNGTVGRCADLSGSNRCTAGCNI